MRPHLLAGAILLALAGTAHAAETCGDLAKLKGLPAGFKTISRSALGPAELHIESDGKCTCNDLPAVQRSLGQAAPGDVNWACDAADAADAGSK